MPSIPQKRQPHISMRLPFYLQFLYIVNPQWFDIITVEKMKEHTGFVLKGVDLTYLTFFDSQNWQRGLLQQKRNIGCKSLQIPNLGSFNKVR